MLTDGGLQEKECAGTHNKNMFHHHAHLLQNTASVRIMCAHRSLGGCVTKRESKDVRASYTQFACASQTFLSQSVEAHPEKNDVRQLTQGSPRSVDTFCGRGHPCRTGTSGPVDCECFVPATNIHLEASSPAQVEAPVECNVCCRRRKLTGC